MARTCSGEIVRYDAAIIGAGANGLAAAATLARAGLTAIVIERTDLPGGRLATREFHPGFRASPFLDELAPMPLDIFWSLGLAQRGVDFLSAPVSLALWPDRLSLFRTGQTTDAASLLAQSASLAHAALERVYDDASRAPPRCELFAAKRSPWPGVDATLPSLDDILASRVSSADARNHLAAMALCGRTADPYLPGSATHLLAPGGGFGGMVAGGQGRLADALVRSARDAGAQIVYGLEASEIAHRKGRLTGVTLADGSAIEARAVISTLDARKTFLSLFARTDMPAKLREHADAFRMAGSTARVLIALERVPALAHGEALRGPIYISPDLRRFADAHLAWRAGAIASEIPIALRIPSIMDSSLAPPGCAVMTATLGAIPCRLFDGAWTHQKRDALRDITLAAVETVLPGTLTRIVATEVIAPSDMEESLAITDGDLWGGEIAADQLLDLRPWSLRYAPRTQIEGLYLGGASSAAGAVATCAAGVAAARAVQTDLKRRWFA
jgi:phytoene dehydrogenase-like protein